MENPLSATFSEKSSIQSGSSTSLTEHRSVFDLPLHASCARCHHWHNKVTTGFPRDSLLNGKQERVTISCERCNHKMFGLGANSTQTTFASQETTSASQESLPLRIRNDGSHEVRLGSEKLGSEGSKDAIFLELPEDDCIVPENRRNPLQFFAKQHTSIKRRLHRGKGQNTSSGIKSTADNNTESVALATKSGAITSLSKAGADLDLPSLIKHGSEGNPETSPHSLRSKETLKADRHRRIAAKRHLKSLRRTSIQGAYARCNEYYFRWKNKASSDPTRPGDQVPNVDEALPDSLNETTVVSPTSFGLSSEKTLLGPAGGLKKPSLDKGDNEAMVAWHASFEAFRRKVDRYEGDIQEVLGCTVLSDAPKSSPVPRQVLHWTAKRECESILTSDNSATVDTQDLSLLELPHLPMCNDIEERHGLVLVVSTSKTVEM